MMRRVYPLPMLCAFALLSVSSLWAQTPLAARIGHTDPSKYTRSRSHNSAGDMACELLVPPTAMDVNLNFMHRCEIMPGGGVGAHFHNTNEEMFIIFDGQVQVNGETAAIHKGDAVPIRFNEVHSFVNNGSADLELMIVGISAQKNVLDTELGEVPHAH